MSSPNKIDHKSSEGCHALSPTMLIHQHQQLQQQQQQQEQHLFNLQQQQMQNFPIQQADDNQFKSISETEICLTQKRSLYAIKEQTEDETEDVEEESKQRQTSEVLLDNAYDADVDDDVPMRSVTVVMTSSEGIGDVVGVGQKAQRAMDERQHIYEVSRRLGEGKFLQ